MTLFDPMKLAAFCTAGIALNLTPGPDTMYTLTRSIGQGRRAGVVSALGIFTGCFVHILFAALGLSALLARSAMAFAAVKWIGAAYLVWVGAQMLVGRAGDLTVQRLQPQSLGSIFRQGVATNVLNPKVALFFLAFLPQFVDASRGAPALQLALFGLIFDTTGALWLLFLALAAGSVGNWLQRNQRIARGQRLATGAIFVGLGARLALGDRR